MGNELVKKAEVVSAELVETNVMTGELVSLEGKDGAYELVEKQIGIPADLVYKIKSGEKGEGGFYASLYDLIANIKGMQFGEPKTVYEDDYRVRVSVPVEYWNKEGKWVVDQEEYEIDCRLLYEKARFGWEKKEWDKKEGKMVVTAKAKITVKRDPKHPEKEPMIIVELPDDGEAELYENFLTLRRNKLSKAITCAHRRLIQRAIGIKKFAANTRKEDWDKDIKMKLFSFLPAETDRKAGVRAVHDLTQEPIPLEKTEKPDATAEETIGKKEEKREGEREEKKEEKKETTKTGEAGKPVCAFEGCGVEVAKVVADYSQKFYGKTLCRKHQPKKA